MSNGRPSGALLENLLTILVHDPKHGKVVANLVDPQLFEGDYRDIAERAVDYWRQYDRAPAEHMPDLLADILEDPQNRRGKTFRRIIISMLELTGSINVGYVLHELRTFTRLQRLKDAITKSAEKITAQQELAIEEVEAMWADMLRVSEQTFDLGLSLSDMNRILDGLGADEVNEFDYGIGQLDKRGIVPRRGEATLFLAPKGFGKTWACIHVGRSSLLRRKKVVHVSLEMNEVQVARRYYQSLFSVSRREASVRVPVFDRDDDGKLTAINHDKVAPEFTFRSSILNDEILQHGLPLGNRMGNLRIKRFPTRDLTVRQLEAYLDMLEQVEGFIPDLLILDYIGIMKTDEKNLRLSLSAMFENLRGLLVRRNLAGFVPHQTSRESVEARLIKPTHVAEAFGLVHTADTVITMSRSALEKNLGTARLFVGHSRDEGDGFGCIITQSYELGQFCLDSAYLNGSYFDLLDDHKDAPAADEYDNDGQDTDDS